MEEKKLTDDEIVNAYIRCVLKRGDCDNCPYDEVGCGVDGNDLIKIINRQKAEIERLKIDIKNEKNWGKIQTKQAVKDTAKEILRTLIEKAYVNECIDLTVAEVKAWFREDYGVEL